MKNLLIAILLISTQAFGQNDFMGVNIFRDSVKFTKQIQYESNLSSTFNARSLVDKGYVDSVSALLVPKSDSNTLFVTPHSLDSAMNTAGGGSATLTKPGNADYTALGTDEVIVYETTLTNDRTLTIPTATGKSGVTIKIKNAQSANFLVLLSSVSSILKDGSSLSQLSKSDWVSLISDGTSWHAYQSSLVAGSGVSVLKGYGSEATLANSASPTVYTYTLPSSSMVKKGDRLRVTVWFLTAGGGTDNITVAIKSGVNTVLAKSSTSFGSSTLNEFTTDITYEGATSSYYSNYTYSSDNLVRAQVSGTSSLMDFTGAIDFSIQFTTGATTTVTPVYCQYQIFKE